MQKSGRPAATRIILFLDRIPFLIAGICLVLLVAHVTLDVVFSRLLNNPIKYTIEISSYYYMVVIVFLPLANVERHGEHINVDFIVKALPAGAKKIVAAFTSLLGAAVAAFLAYRTGIDAVRAMTAGEIVMGTGFLVIWPGRWMLPIGFALLAVSMTAGVLLRSYNEANPSDNEGKAAEPGHIGGSV